MSERDTDTRGTRSPDFVQTPVVKRVNISSRIIIIHQSPHTHTRPRSQVATYVRYPFLPGLGPPPLPASCPRPRCLRFRAPDSTAPRLTSQQSRCGMGPYVSIDPWPVVDCRPSAAHEPCMTKFGGRRGRRRGVAHRARARARATGTAWLGTASSSDAWGLGRCAVGLRRKGRRARGSESERRPPARPRRPRTHATAKPTHARGLPCEIAPGRPADHVNS